MLFVLLCVFNLLADYSILFLGVKHLLSELEL